MDFDKGQHRVGQSCWSKTDSNYLDVKLEVIKKDANRDFCLAQNFTRREPNSNHNMRLQNLLVIVQENICRGDEWYSVPNSLKCKDTDRQMKVAHKVVDVVDRSNTKVYGILLWFNVEKSFLKEALKTQNVSFSRNKKDSKPNFLNANLFSKRDTF